jgi:hypothetical protein
VADEDEAGHRSIMVRHGGQGWLGVEVEDLRGASLNLRSRLRAGHPDRSWPKMMTKLALQKTYARWFLI